MPATPVMARRPWKISACTFHDSCSGEEPRPRGSKPLSAGRRRAAGGWWAAGERGCGRRQRRAPLRIWAADVRAPGIGTGATATDPAHAAPPSTADRAAHATHRRAGCRPGSRAPPRCCRGTCIGRGRVLQIEMLPGGARGALSSAGGAVRPPALEAASGRGGARGAHHRSRSAAAATTVRRTACGVGGVSVGRWQGLGGGVARRTRRPPLQRTPGPHRRHPALWEPPRSPRERGCCSGRSWACTQQRTWCRRPWWGAGGSWGWSLGDSKGGRVGGGRSLEAPIPGGASGSGLTL